MNSANKKIFFKNLVFEVYSDVYEPAEDSFLFAENLHSEEGFHVLDMGTGSGILGIVAAARSSKVVVVDVNPYAISCAYENSKRNGVHDKLSFLVGDLFAPLDESAKFDLILFNAPYLPSEQTEENSWLERAWAGGATGRKVINKFISQSTKRLRKGGTILLMQSTLSNVEETLIQFRALQMEARPIAKLRLPFFETIVLVKARYSN